MANPLIKPIKKELSKKYGYKNVSVKNGQGTAWGWVKISVNLKKPNLCECGKNDLIGYCDYCKNGKGQVNTSKEIEKIAIEALQKENLKPYTYTADDGYYSERNEMLVSINYI